MLRITKRTIHHIRQLKQLKNKIKFDTSRSSQISREQLKNPLSGVQHFITSAHLFGRAVKHCRGIFTIFYLKSKSGARALDTDKISK